MDEKILQKVRALFTDVRELAQAIDAAYEAEKQGVGEQQAKELLVSKGWRVFAPLEREPLSPEWASNFGKAARQAVLELRCKTPEDIRLVGKAAFSRQPGVGRAALENLEAVAGGWLHPESEYGYVPEDRAKSDE